MNKSLFTADEIQELKKEYVEFVVNEMRPEDMASFIRNTMLSELNPLSEDDLRAEIDYYDEYLYEMLASCVKDEEGSWDAMQEYIHERHEHDWIDDV